jgi:hypothetical protein
MLISPTRQDLTGEKFISRTVGEKETSRITREDTEKVLFPSWNYQPGSLYPFNAARGIPINMAKLYLMEHERVNIKEMKDKAIKEGKKVISSRIEIMYGREPETGKIIPMRGKAILRKQAIDASNVKDLSGITPQIIEGKGMSGPIEVEVRHGIWEKVKKGMEVATEALAEKPKKKKGVEWVTGFRAKKSKKKKKGVIQSIIEEITEEITKKIEEMIKKAKVKEVVKIIKKYPELLEILEEMSS